MMLTANRTVAPFQGDRNHVWALVEFNKSLQQWRIGGKLPEQASAPDGQGTEARVWVQTDV